MRFTNQTPHPAAWTLAFEPDGREMLVVIVKATYSLPVAGEPAAVAAQQVALVQADQFTGDPGASAPLHETDFAHRKPACDVLLVGSAYAPRGRRVARTEVALEVGALAKRFAVVGERRWRRQLGRATASSPEPFAAMPISYDVAFGGTDGAGAHPEAYPLNPVGRGYCRQARRSEGRLLPCTEELHRPVQDGDGRYAPMALSPIGRNWAPRAGHAGTYDQAWIETTAPLWPADFDPRYFQAAPPDQRMAYPQGGERVVLRNLTPDGQRAFELPARRMPVTFIPHRGRDVTLRANLDTIVLEPDAERFTLAWRANLPLGQSVFDVRETIVGDMPAAWHRARRFPGKAYHAGLGALVAQRKARG